MGYFQPKLNLLFMISIIQKNFSDLFNLNISQIWYKQKYFWIQPSCVRSRWCLAFNQRKQFWKSRNFFYSPADSWLDYRLLRFYRLFFIKKCRYDAWESIQDFDNLQLVPSLLTEYDKGRYIWDHIFVFVPYHTQKKK